MPLTRRALLSACAGALPAWAAASSLRADGKTSLGLVIHSFPIRSARDRAKPAAERFGDPVRYLEYCGALGAGGVQVSIGARDDAYADALRAKAEAASMYLEGTISLPRDDADVDRFEAEIRTAKRAGATVVRTAMLSGRRYETFSTLAAFRQFAERAERSLVLARPVVARHDVRLAVENHKDWRADEMLALLKRVNGDHIGICVDTGNSIALLEDPMEVVEALAPLALTTHLKDMGVEEYPDGFLLSEVPFGAGFLDMERIVRVLRAARPEIRWNLEMITRDPLKVPCLTERYWATMPDLPARHLARALALVRDHRPPQPLPRISGLSPEGQLRAEDDNMARCLAYWREHQGR
jgi:sugar phosphate isomerase/epimerase